VTTWSSWREGRPVTIRTSLCDGVVRIRRYRTADIDAIHQAAMESIAEITPWEDWLHEEYRRSDTAAWIEAQPEMWKNGNHAFVIEDVTTGTVLGSSGINKIDPRHRNANLGYWVRSSWTRRGVATRATFLAARFAFEDLELIRVGIVAAVENTASRRVAERVGARFEGVLHHGLMIRGVGRDAALYSLTTEDLPRFPPVVEEPAGSPR